MKVLLVHPPFDILKTEAKKCHPPLGLAYLAAILKDGHEVTALDALAEGYDKEEAISGDHIRYGLSFDEIRTRIEGAKPDAVGVSSLFSTQALNAHKICRIAKAIDGKIITVVGGAHPSAVPLEVMKDDDVDFVVIGEGEMVLKGLLERLESGKPVKDLEGLAFREEGRVRINPRRDYYEDLDALPFPRWDIFPLERYFKINNPHGSPARKVPFMPVITSRGCPFECIFCSIYNVWGRKYRKRSAENVLAEITHLIDKYGVKEILFEDDNLTLDKERAKRIFQGMIDRDLGLVWNVPNGVAVQTLDDEVLQLMKRSGCYSISIGVESGDEYILKNVIKKPIDLSSVKPVIRKARALGLETSVFFVVGLPDEKIENMRNTFRFAESLQADNINFFFATPLPGTRLQERCMELGLLDEKADYSKLRSEYPSFTTSAFSRDELISLVLRERLKLYFLSLLMDPKNFLKKFMGKLLKNPVYFKKFWLKYLRIRQGGRYLKTKTGDNVRI